MKLTEIAKLDKDFLTPSEVASVLNCSPQAIRAQALNNPSLLGFNFCKVGNRIKIPRLAFIDWMQKSN